MFKGLQKPIEFMGIQGRYITWAAIAVGGAILGFIIVYCIFGFLAGLIVLAVSLLAAASQTHMSHSFYYVCDKCGHTETFSQIMK